MGFGYTFLIAPIVIGVFFPIGGLISGIVLMPIGAYFALVRKSLIIGEDRFMIKTRMPFYAGGKWNDYENFKAITIKYTILNAKGGNRRGNAPQDPMKKIDLKNPNQNSEDTAETWLVHLVNQDNEKIQLINSNKQLAVKVAVMVMKQSNLKPYLANFRKGFELNETLLKQGVLKLDK